MDRREETEMELQLQLQLRVYSRRESLEYDREEEMETYDI